MQESNLLHHRRPEIELRNVFGKSWSSWRHLRNKPSRSRLLSPRWAKSRILRRRMQTCMTQCGAFVPPGRSHPSFRRRGPTGDKASSVLYCRELRGQGQEKGKVARVFKMPMYVLPYARRGTSNLRTRALLQHNTQDPGGGLGRGARGLKVEASL